MPELGRVLAVDYGARRTGLAVSDPLGLVATPLEPCVSEDLDETLARIVTEVREREVRTVLVGMPYLPDGREGRQVQVVRLFLDALRRVLPAGVGLEELDERDTTNEARALLREGGIRGPRAKARLDGVAAVVLLREYLDRRHQRPRPDPEPPDSEPSPDPAD